MIFINNHTSLALNIAYFIFNNIMKKSDHSPLSKELGMVNLDFYQFLLLGKFYQINHF